MVELLRVRSSLLRMAPPTAAPLFPLVNTSPVMETFTRVPRLASILNIRLLLSASMITLPSPSMVRALLITSSLARVMMVRVATGKVIVSKSTVSPTPASTMAWRKLPAPESLVLITVIVAATRFAGNSRRRKKLRQQDIQLILNCLRQTWYAFVK